MELRHVLILCDLSGESLGPCEPAAELALKFGARLTLLHVLHDLHVGPPGAHLGLPLRVSGGLEEARAALRERAALLDPALQVDVAVVRGGDVAGAVVEYVRENDIDLIALSKHGRKGIEHFVLGSVAEAVLRHSPVPVLAFPRR